MGLQPLSSTLDASASVLRKGADAPAAEERPAQASRRGKAGPAIPGQGTLSVSAFAANAAGPEGVVEDGEGEGRENEPNQLPFEDAAKPEAETSRKRKAKEAATPKKPASKAPRKSADKAKKVPSKA